MSHQGEKEKKLHLIQCPERSCKAIIIKHPCICVQTISQLLPLILYMQKGADWPQSLVSPPDHDPFIQEAFVTPMKTQPVYSF